VRADNHIKIWSVGGRWQGRTPDQREGLLGSDRDGGGGPERWNLHSGLC